MFTGLRSAEDSSITSSNRSVNLHDETTPITKVITETCLGCLTVTLSQSNSKEYLSAPHYRVDSSYCSFSVTCFLSCDTGAMTGQSTVLKLLRSEMCDLSSEWACLLTDVHWYDKVMLSVNWKEKNQSAQSEYLKCLNADQSAVRSSNTKEWLGGNNQWLYVTSLKWRSDGAWYWQHPEQHQKD